MKMKSVSVLLIIALFAFVGQGFCQNQLQIIGVTPTADSTMILTWQGNSNEMYEINEADTLVNGATVWNKLYDDYPSQGTNTFWMDAGNYFTTPPIVSPKFSPMRFYRVLMTGTNTEAPPTVSIASPANGTVLSNAVTVSVSASANDVLTDVLLFVDGQQMSQSLDGTNFLINTCEWANGPHVLFAVAKSQSSLSPSDTAITFGRAVSTFMNVTFDNLIEQIAFSQPFFEPSLGQIQQVTAVFAANVNWTLQIQDSSTNTVQSATGSGLSMSYNWDGTGSNEVSIPDGIYTYHLSAVTNGASDQIVGGGGGGGGSPPTPDVAGADLTASLIAGTIQIPLPPLPLGMSYGFDAEGNEITTITVQRPLHDTRRQRHSSLNGTGISSSELFPPNDSPSGGGDPPAPAYSQSTDAPVRPPTVGVKNPVGTFGVVYFTFPNGLTTQAPRTGFPYAPYFVGLNGQQGQATVRFGPLDTAKDEAMKFSDYMTKQGWKQVFMLSDGQVTPIALKKSSLGGSNLFNTVNIGLFITHGDYGSTYESDFVYYSYVWFPDGTYSRLSDFDFGSPGTNGLRWMTIHACGSLNQNCYNSMVRSHKFPVNSSLHLLLGSSTPTTYMYGPVGLGYAFGLVGINSNMQLSVPNAWFNAGTNAYQVSRPATAVNFTVVGWDNCFSDTVSSFPANTSGTLQYLDVNVFTPH